MKFTKRQIKQIIKEEIHKLLREGYDPAKADRDGDGEVEDWEERIGKKIFNKNEESLDEELTSKEKKEKKELESKLDKLKHK